MLNYKLLNYKPTTKRNGITFIDLAASNFEQFDGIDGQFIIVNKYYVARPDLISLAMYRTDSYADVICKVNGISNPFELNEDDILFIPSIEYTSSCCKNNSSPSEFVDEDDELKKIEKKTQKKFDEIRSPNEQIEGEKNYVIDKSYGLVFY